jgi:hypothetical protein
MLHTRHLCDFTGSFIHGPGSRARTAESGGSSVQLPEMCLFLQLKASRRLLLADPSRAHFF